MRQVESVYPKLSHWFLYWPAFFAGLLYFIFSKLNPSFLTFFLLMAAIIDSGHVYTTFFKTYFDVKQLLNKKHYVLVPLMILSISFSLLLKAPLAFWSIFFYWTAFHHIRQYYGVFVLDTKTKNRSEKWLYQIILFIPLIGMHFRENFNLSFYHSKEISFFYSEQLFNGAVVLFVLTLVVFLMMRQIKKPPLSDQFKAVTYPMILFYALMISTDIKFSIVVLIFSHAVSYIYLVFKTQEKTIFKRKPSLLIILLFTFIVGSLSFFTEDLLPMGTETISVFSASAIATLLTPVLFHYFIDGVIWKVKS